VIPVFDVVAGVLGLPAETVTEDVSPATEGVWTSLKHLELAVAIEEHYHVSLSAKEIRRLTSVGRIREVLREKGVVA